MLATSRYFIHRLRSSVSGMALLVVWSILLSGCVAVSRELRFEESQNIDKQRFHNTADEYLNGRVLGGSDGQMLCRYLQSISDRIVPLVGEESLVRQYKEGILMILPSDRIFSSGKADIRESYLPVLDSIANVFASSCHHCDLFLLVHTDNNCSNYVALSLSERRAKYFFKELKSRGVRHIHHEGKGYSAPLLPNDNEEYRSINRRVEIAVLARRNKLKQIANEIDTADTETTASLN